MNLNISEYGHFSFDLWLTLIKSNPEFKAKRNLLFKEYFEINVPIEKVTEVIRYYDVLCNNINEKSELNFNTFEIYYLILNALEVDIELLEAENLEDFYKETEQLFMTYKPNLIYSDIESVFKKITKHEKTISILSNTGFIKGSSLRKLLEYYELNNYFSFQLYSDETGFSKPNSRMFQLVFNKVCEIKALEKKNILHVGDNVRADYNGAVNFGFSALLI